MNSKTTISSYHLKCTIQTNRGGNNHHYVVTVPTSYQSRRRIINQKIEEDVPKEDLNQ